MIAVVICTNVILITVVHNFVIIIVITIKEIKNFLLDDPKVVLMKCLLAQVAPKSTDDIFNNSFPVTNKTTRYCK